MELIYVKSFIAEGSSALALQWSTGEKTPKAFEISITRITDNETTKNHCRIFPFLQDYKKIYCQNKINEDTVKDSLKITNRFQKLSSSLSDSTDPKLINDLLTTFTQSQT